MNQRASAYANPLLLLLLAIIGSRLLTMAILPFSGTTEPRYAVIARIMAETGDWITPWYDNGTPFWGKPPLSFWLQALSIRLFGIDEFSARLPAWLVTLGIVLLIHALGKRLYGREAALWSTLVFSSMALTYVAAGAVMTDVFLTLGSTLAFVSIAMLSLGARSFWRWLFFIGLAVGLLAKGPLVLVLTGGTLMIWLAWSAGAGRVLGALPWVRGTLVTAAVSLPWYLMAEWRTPGFLDYFILGEHLLRFIDPGWQGDLYGSAHDQPYGTIWWYWLLASFPWGFAVIALAARRTVAAHRGAVPLLPQWSDGEKLLVSSAILPGLFFTLSGNILWTYQLPAMPALALLLGLPLSEMPMRKAACKLRKMSILVVPVVVTLGGSWASFHPLQLRTEKYLVQAYRSARGTSGAPLHYIRKAPFSARYYGADAIRILNSTEALAQLKETDRSVGYFAVRRPELELLQAQSAVRCEPIANSKRHVLLECHYRPGDSSSGSERELLF